MQYANSPTPMPISPSRAIPCSLKRGSADRVMVVLTIIRATEIMYHKDLEYDTAVLFQSSESFNIIKIVYS